MTAQTLRKSSKLDKAIIASITAVLAMNVFVLAQQLDSSSILALTKSAPQAQQA